MDLNDIFKKEMKDGDIGLYFLMQIKIKKTDVHNKVIQLTDL